MRADRFVLSAARALPPVAVVAASLGLVAAEGGYFQRDWLPVAIGLAGALAVCLSARWTVPRSALARLGLGLLGGFVAWCFLSILWAGMGGVAWDAANRYLLYLLAVTVLALYPWSPASARRLLLAWCLGLTGVLLVSVAFAAAVDDPRDVMINGRFSYPIGYAGGSAALAAVGVWPAVLLSARGETPAVLRPVLLAAAAFMLEYALLPQSRGALVGLAAGLVVLVALAPDRLRVLARLGILAIAVLATMAPVLDAYAPFDERTVDPGVLEDAWRSMALAALLAGVGGALFGLVEHRVPAVRPAAIRVHPRIAPAAAAVALLMAVGVVAANGAGIRDSARERWQEFQSGDGVAASGPSRFTATGDPARYDYWRVALGAFADNPLEGLGAGNYEARYAAERDHPKYSRYAHSLWLNVMAETGLIGLLLLVGAVACAVAAVLAGRRALAPAGRATLAACLAVTACLLGHATVDWVEQFPAVAIPGLGFLFVAVRLATPEVPGGGSNRRGKVLRASAAILTAAAVVSMALPYVSLRYAERAARSARTAPAEAYDDLERAQAWNPLSLRVRLQEANLAIELGHFSRARAALRDAPDAAGSWFAHLQSALLYAHERSFTAARAEIDRAAELNSTEPFVQRVRQDIRRRVSSDPRRVIRALLRRTGAQFR